MKTVLITGAGGSIGSELSRQVIALGYDVVLVDNCENNAYKIEMETGKLTLVADIKNFFRMRSIFKKYRPTLVFHAAAYKHLPLMERNISEAVENNIYGTIVLSMLSVIYGVERFVMTSTDKAVNPTSVMGATKRVAEIVLQLFHFKTKFIAVRFGNVIGSSGSVIPLFKKQIENGEDLTVTHKDVVRFFMTIKEASELVITAGNLGTFGDIFILDMGELVSIDKLARDMIYESKKPLGIKYIGLREGEKLYEEIMTDEEGLTASSHEKIFITKPCKVPMFTILRIIRLLFRPSKSNLKSIVKNYTGE